jgi:hypothetical protein
VPATISAITFVSPRAQARISDAASFRHGKPTSGGR